MKLLKVLLPIIILIIIVFIIIYFKPIIITDNIINDSKIYLKLNRRFNKCNINATIYGKKLVNEIKNDIKKDGYVKDNNKYIFLISLIIIGVFHSEKYIKIRVVHSFKL